MKSQLKSWMVTLAVVLLSTAGVHACSDEQVAAFFANLGELPSQLGDGGDVSVLATGSSETCGEYCDGEIPDFYVVEMTGTLPTTSFAHLILGGVSFEYNTSGESAEAATVEADLIAQVNDSETGSEFFSAQAGSIELFPFNVFNIASVATSSSGGLLQITGDDVNDTLALTDALFAFFSGSGSGLFERQDLVDAAIDAGVIPESVDTERKVSLQAYQQSDCPEGGTVRVTQQAVIPIDGDELVDGDSDLEIVTVLFTDCAIEGDWLGNGGDEETVAFDGSLQATTVLDDDVLVTVVSGTVALDTDDGASNPFWVDSVNANLGWVEDATEGLEEGDFDGGICYGGTVAFGNETTSDEDDSCLDDEGVFVGAENFYDSFVD